jgi:alginate O-acetyltransferase complex protein AlgI
MLFNSIEFLYFFIVVTTLFFVLPYKVRWLLLLAASCFFYMFFKPVYILILAFTIVIDYFAGIFLEQEQNHSKKKYYLIASLIANIGVLAVFKYYNFLNTNLTALTSVLHLRNPIPYLNILLPIGLSFHTFQAMSYTLEIYYGRQKAERHFGIYALYVMFYPQLVAGPIERPQAILPQFHQRQHFSLENARLGLNLIAIGLFKKIVVADRLALYVDELYANVHGANTISALLAVIFYTIQIYCDFSGYSDIARGTAKFMGFDLMLNFDFPLLSKSMTDFWRKWHISLSSWFRDYVYIPLGGNRVSKALVCFNLFITFLLSGLWHGAAWTFIVWGILHSIALMYEFLTRKTRAELGRKIPEFLNNTLSWLFTVSFVCFAFIFFRADSFGKAKAVIQKILSHDFSFNMVQLCVGKGPLNLVVTFVVLLLWGIIRLPKENTSYTRNVMFLGMITFLIIIFGRNAESNFIYFQF